VTPDEALGRAEEAGIRRLQIPTPFAVGRVNCYLLSGEPLTLVDTGPNSGKSLDEMERQLGALGHAIEDLDLIVITHQHLDHTGLVEVLAGRSGAEVAAIELMVDFMRNYGDDAERDDQFAAGLMIRYGITRPLRDGERLELGDRALEVLHRPGHSPSDTVFWDADRRILIAADHLLPDISSNPLISRPLDGSSERPQALVTYIESLKRTRELPAEIVLPGHGDPITDHRALIDERLALHERRAEKIHGLIAQRPMTAFEVAQELWGNVAVTQAFLTLSEVVGHVDLLINAGSVREVADGEVVRFETTK
jgi:glyoxylase-like metal-dependent hydrolase (beta-lactamase superfamily II)